jgi:hypothetical protein
MCVHFFYARRQSVVRCSRVRSRTHTRGGRFDMSLCVRVCTKLYLHTMYTLYVRLYTHPQPTWGMCVCARTRQAPIHEHRGVCVRVCMLAAVNAGHRPVMLRLHSVHGAGAIRLFTLR